MNKLSIKLRVTLWYSLILILISGVVLFAVISVSQQMLVRDSSDKLIGTVNEVSRMVTEPRRDPRMMPGFRFFDKGVHTALYDDERNLIGGYMPYEFAGDILLNDAELKEKRYDGEDFITYVKKVTSVEGSDMWVIGVISIANESSMLNSVRNTNLLIALILIITAAIGGYFIMRQALKPVDRISKTAKTISKSKDLSQRISLGKGNDEIYRLADTFDEMLDRIETSFEKEKQFTSDASHELRTPVAVINSECEYVLDCADSIEDVKESVKSIKRQSDKMSKLISELLTISRMDKNTIKTTFEKIDLSELLGFVCDEQEEIQEGNIKLIRNIKPDVWLKGDRSLIARMLVNLISNGYTYGKDGGMVEVFLDEDDKNVIIKIKDDGIGISEEDISKIWERFYQADKSRVNDEKGNMGLGLSMVKWIVECHRGNAYVESELGIGSVFTVVLPK